MATSNWLLLQVKPRQEMRALENLERQQAQCYCPLIQVEKLRRGKRIQVGYDEGQQLLIFKPADRLEELPESKETERICAKCSGKGKIKISSVGIGKLGRAKV